MTVSVEIIGGREGNCLVVNEYRVAGSKPWGGGSVLAGFHGMALREFAPAIPELADLLAVPECLLQRAKNLERYPFESATMAEAGRLAAKHLREAARTPNMTTKTADSVQVTKTCTGRYAKQAPNSTIVVDDLGGIVCEAGDTVTAERIIDALHASEPHEVFYVQFAPINFCDDGEAIRKWSRTPFEGARLCRVAIASGIETEGHDPEDGHGAKHESPTGEAGDAQ